MWLEWKYFPSQQPVWGCVWGVLVAQQCSGCCWAVPVWSPGFLLPVFSLGSGLGMTRSWEVIAEAADPNRPEGYCRLYKHHSLSKLRERGFWGGSHCWYWSDTGLLVAGPWVVAFVSLLWGSFWSSLLHLLKCPYLDPWSCFSLPILFLPHWAGSVWMAVGV